MKTTLINLNCVACLVSLMASTATACPGARLSLNDDTVLTGDTIKIESLKETTPSKSVMNKPLVARSKDGTETHHFIVLGQNSDPEGVLSTSYLVKELSTQEEKVWVLTTNYLGNGMFVRGSPTRPFSQRDVSEFSILFTAGCDF